VITTDRDHVVSSINIAATRLLSVQADCVGQPPAGISSVEVPLLELADRIAERGEAIRDHDCVDDRGGRIRRFRADAHVLKDAVDQRLGCVILLRDVSERVLMEERVRRMEQFLILGTLASGLHHEIKNPLTALSLHVQLLDERLRDPVVRTPLEELIDVVKSELLRLNGVLDSVRNFVNLEKLTVRPIDVFGLLEDVIRLIGPQAAQQRVEVNLRPKEMDLPLVPVDAEKIKQAVLNLVFNTLEAMPRGGVLTLNVSARGRVVQVEVADTGPGIPPEI
jgi:two-component system, NtrC family, sensor histidine kinase HydH